MCMVSKFIDWGMERWERFTVLDVAAFKLCLLSLGTLLGMYLVKPLKKLAPLIWIVAIASYAYIVWRMVFCDEQ